MGCWNGTCMVSNLPVKEGDKIAIIPIYISNNTYSHTVYYTTDMCRPLPIILYGEYDDYGCAENITGDVKEFNDFMTNYCLEDLLEQHTDPSKNFVENNLRIIERDNFSNIAFVMIHKDIFDKLIINNDEYLDEDELKEIIDDIYNKFTGGKEYLLNDSKPFHFTRDIKLINKDSFFKLFNLNNNLSSLRKLWAPQCGAGGQSSIDKAHEELSEFYSNYIKKYKEDMENEED